MIKNIVYTGIIIIIISILLLFFESSQLSSQNLNISISKILTVKNYTVGSDSFADYNVNLNTTSDLMAFMNSSSSVNFYLMNNSAFSSWKKLVANTSSNKTGIEDAISLENKGVYYIYKNVSTLSIPSGLLKNSSTEPLFSEVSNFNSVYYLVIDNTKGSPSSNKQVNATLVYIPPLTNQTLNSPQLAQVKNLVNEAMWMGSIFFILLIAGIGVLAYGLIKKPKTIYVETDSGKSKIDLSNVDELYNGIEEKPKKQAKLTKPKGNKKVEKSKKSKK